MRNLKRCHDDIVNILSNYNKDHMSWSKLSKDINFIETFDEVYPNLKNESIRVKAYFIFDNYKYEDILCPCCNTKVKRFTQSDASKSLVSRLHFQKFKLESNLEKYDSKLTALENMVNNGYRVIYDSGNLVYSKQI